MKSDTDSTKSSLSAWDWNFDSVPDSELMGCCYWEYARESTFIREVRRRSLEAWRTGGHWDGGLNTDLITLQSIEYAAEVFLRGFSFEPDVAYQIADPKAPHYRHPEAPPITGSFPQPWQSLAAAERACRARIRTDREAIPLVPFKRGYAFFAEDIARWYKNRRASAAEGEEIHPSLFSAGAEIGVVEIQWGAFTNDELVNGFRKWVKANRPQQFPKPSGRGHKPGDWRAKLTRLAVMRLLSRYTPKQILGTRLTKPVGECQPIHGTKQFTADKWADATKWHDARREARRIFQQLLPFLPKDELPLSWQRQPPGK